MDYIYDIWYLLAILIVFALCIGAISLVWAISEFISRERSRFKKACRRKARMKERARRAQASAGKPPVRSPFVSRKTRYLIQHREEARRYRAGI